MASILSKLEAVTWQAYGKILHGDMQPIEFIQTPSTGVEVWRFGNHFREHGRIIGMGGRYHVLVRADRELPDWRVLAGCWDLRPAAYRALVFAWLRHAGTE